MNTRSHILIFLSWVLVMFYSSPSADGTNMSKTHTHTHTHTHSNTKYPCISHERDALLQFKRGVGDNYGVLSSWGDHDDHQQDCCLWHGVRCSNVTGHVIGLHLHGGDEYYLEGKLSPSLVKLKHLEYLDLSMNNFQAQPIPSFIGSLFNLMFLNLSNNQFEGEIPHHLGNLSNLAYLDLSYNCYGYLYATSLGWLSHLTLLRKVELSCADLSYGSDSFFKSVSELPFLRVLQVERCNLYSPPVLSSLSYLNSSTAHLSVVSLSRNELNDSLIFQWMLNMSLSSTGLVYVDLSDNSIPGPIPSAFGNNNMHALSYLDISGNPLGGPIPSSFGLMKSLSYLCISGSELGGSIPFSFGLMKSLSFLDASDNYLGGSIPNSFGLMKSLSYLDVSRNQLRGPIPFSFGLKKSLSYLDLSENQLEGPIPSSLGNMTALSYLSLSDNRFECPLPDSISNLKHLTHLDLSSNNFQGSGCLPKTIGNVCSLQELDLSNNNMTDEFHSIIHALSVGCAHKSLSSLNLERNRVWGSIPDKIATFSSLSNLFLSHNQLNNTISQNLGQLSTLEKMYLSDNSFRGTLSDNHLSNLSRLSELDVSGNSALVVNMSSNWIPPFQLDVIDMHSCNLGPRFPKWLLYQNNYSELDISNTRISDTIPHSFWNLLPTSLDSLNLSHNNIHEGLPADIALHAFPAISSDTSFIDLSSNLFEGKVPSFLINVNALLLNDNKFTDVGPLLCPATNKMSMSATLDLSNNFLSGKLPDCWANFDQLSILRLENNNLSGILPTSIGALRHLQMLHLRNNSFSGELPKSLENCTSLAILDAAYNSFTGYIPPRIGRIFKGINVLNLRSNNLYGQLPMSLCELSRLQILDLSSNHISGTIPDCIDNLTAMANSSDFLPYAVYDGPRAVTIYNDTATIKWKGMEERFIFTNILGLLKSIDISHNELHGIIPSGIF